MTNSRPGLPFRRVESSFGFSLKVIVRSTLVALSLLVAVAVQGQTPSTTDTPEPPQVVAAGLAGLENDRGRGGASTGNMTYHNGAVQRAQKVYTIFWNPTATPFPSSYQATINQFVQDLNGSSYYAIASQYSDTTGNIGTAVSYGGTWLDTTNAIPNNPPTTTDIFNEMNRAKTANGWTSDSNSLFQVFTPSGYGTTTDYCGYHVLNNPAYGLILYPSNHTSGTCFPGGTYPNSNVIDAAINTFAHEILEAVTDPLGGGWYYLDYAGEIADLCNFTFGTRGSDGSNATLNGRKYLIQQEWSNASSGCVMSYAAQAAPTVTTGSASSIAKTTATLSGTVNPKGSSSTLYFDYGTSNSSGGYGRFGSSDATA